MKGSKENIDELETYMLTNLNLLKYLSCVNIDSPKTKKKIKKNRLDEEYFNPKQSDSLFWCFYIFKYGMDNYQLLGSNYFETEKNLKITTIEKIRHNKPLLKNHKLRRNEIEDELLNHERITVKSLCALCLYHNLNIMLIDNKKYFEFTVDPEQIHHVIHFINKRYKLELDTTPDALFQYRNKYWKIENYDKPLKSISSYKLKEIHDICTKLDIPLQKDNKRKTKKELYENILMKI